MDKEIVIILKLLLERTLITTKELMDETGLSIRQITYRISKINDLLKSQKVPPISLRYNKDLILKSETRDAILEIIQQHDSEKAFYLKKDERLAFMYLTLFINLEYLSLNHFIDAMKVSRSSILMDFKDLGEILKENGVYIKNNRTNGYYLIGSEMEIRRLMIKIVINTLSINRDCKIFNLFIKEYKLDNFQKSKEIISNLALKHNIKFVEDRLLEFIYIFTFLKARMISKKKSEYEVSKIPNISVIKLMKEYNFTEDLLYSFENGNMIQSFDANYISAWIIGISVGSTKDKTEDISIISKIVIRIMTRFESLSGFHYMNRDGIFEQLYSHFRPAYYRLLFKLPIYNTLCEKVKTEYKELYKLVSETMKPFSELFDQDIPEDELAYLTIHFGAILFNGNESIIPPKKKALIVCSGGIGSSAILYTELKNLFPELHFLLPIELSKLNDICEPIDIIFTSNYSAELMEIENPLIKVSPVMTLKEKSQVKREVYMLLGNTFLRQPRVEEVIEIVRKNTKIISEDVLYNELQAYFSRMENFSIKEQGEFVLSDIISENLIRLGVAAKDWEDAIRKSASVLLKNDKITAPYIDAMITTAKESGPYIVITKHVALPHAKPEAGAKETAMGIAVLQSPIEFGNKGNDPVKYVFCLSAVDHEKHLQAMAEFLELLEKEEFYHILDNAKDPSEIMNYIKAME
ncbi:BglG family transcription antiterminator [Clostridium fungisolvens]|uniref:Transcriptional regulator ManR n=1 Tax=Clostridium fungisolvens TaxID=1604897 RepID=A0A6V8SFS0_9CLOT|nr:BglG family transcription antiterminator [Clostridium fungisolvens]GFP75631.1 Transcriptional regulator ManR [Clostridium fungisolvens]